MFRHQRAAHAMNQSRVRAPLPHSQLVGVLNTLSSGNLSDFAAHNSRLQASFVLLYPSAASAGDGAVARVKFDEDSLPSPQHVRTLLIALAGVVSRGLRVISDLLDSSNSSRSSSGGAGGISESSALLSQLPAVLCLRSCCLACSALVGAQWKVSEGDRRSAVEVAVLAGTSGQCTLAGSQNVPGSTLCLCLAGQTCTHVVRFHQQYHHQQQNNACLCVSARQFCSLYQLAVP
jgi:hypothetical protein